jgi:hypothetical protein
MAHWIGLHAIALHCDGQTLLTHLLQLRLRHAMRRTDFLAPLTQLGELALLGHKLAVEVRCRELGFVGRTRLVLPELRKLTAHLQLVREKAQSACAASD